MFKAIEMAAPLLTMTILEAKNTSMVETVKTDVIAMGKHI
jgi:hypothetical protein